MDGWIDSVNGVFSIILAKFMSGVPQKHARITQHRLRHPACKQQTERRGKGTPKTEGLLQRQNVQPLLRGMDNRQPQAIEASQAYQAFDNLSVAGLQHKNCAGAADQLFAFRDGNLGVGKQPLAQQHKQPQQKGQQLVQNAAALRAFVQAPAKKDKSA